MNRNRTKKASAGKRSREKELPDWHEWDFRTVSPQEVEFAVKYEFCRERKDLRDAAIEWYNKPIGDAVRYSRTRHVDEEKLGNRASLPVKDILQDADVEVQWVARYLTPMALHGALGMMAWKFGEFPAPFLTIDPAVRLARIQEIQKADEQEFYRDQPLWIKPPSPIYSGLFESIHETESRRGVGCYLVRIDWNWTKQKVKEAFDEWLRAQPKAKGVKSKTGRAAAADAPYSKLKWLAARRLQKAGLNWESFPTLYTRDHLKNHRAPDDFLVIPDYVDEGPWRNAVSKGYRFERQLLGG